MMYAYLVQHAAAKPKQEDAQRSLSDKGQADIDKVATYLAKHASVRVGQVVHSGKTRARQTAEILAAALHPARGVSEAPDLAPLDDPARWAERLSTAGEAIMLVGHLPHLSKLAALLICQDDTKKPVDFQNGGVVFLAREETGNWAVRWIVIPDIVE